MDKFKANLKGCFNLKELGPLTKHLGVWYEWGVDNNGCYLESSIDNFVDAMLEDFHDLFH